MEENAKSWRNLFKWMHRVSGNSVTCQKPRVRYVSTDQWSLQTTHLAVLEPISQFLTMVAAVHIVPLQLVRREEICKAVQKGDIRSIEPAGNPIPHPPTPTLPFSAHTTYCFRGRNWQGQVLGRSYDAFFCLSYHHHLECFSSFGDRITCEALHTGNQSPIKDVGDN